MKSEKKQKLLEAALELFVEQGIVETSTANIAKQAGVATGTLFHHFSSKSELIEALYKDIKSRMLSVLEQGDSHTDSIMRGQQFWHDALSWFVLHPRELTFFGLYYSHPDNGYQARVNTLKEMFPALIELIEVSKQQGRFKPLPTDYIVSWLDSQMLASANYLLTHPELEHKQFIEQSFDLCMSGILIKA